MVAPGVVIVGASLAGLRAAESLRRHGFDGSLTIIGEETHGPYERPALSKQILAGTQEPDAAMLAIGPALSAQWRTGVRAAGLDLEVRTVTLGDGEVLPFAGVVLATGAAPRRIPGWPELDGIHVLRTLDDCMALRSDLGASPRRLAVVGAGFIGCEVAAAARGLGLEVTVIEPLAAPCIRGVGARVGGFVADLHRDHGVDLRLGAAVTSVEGSGRVERLRLSDGAVIEADAVIVGVGAAPVTRWLDGSGLKLADGVVCDATCAAAPGVVAAGDVARWEHPRHGSIRIEHWDNAVEQGEHAARTLLAHLAGGTGAPFAPVPWFWSDQFGRKIQLTGRPTAASTVDVVAGSLSEGRFLATYTDRGEVVAAVGVNMPAKVIRWRSRLAELAPSRS